MEIKNKEKEGKRVMPRLKNFLPNMFGGSSKKDAAKLCQTARLETDALPVLPVDDSADANNGRNRPNGQQSTASTPTASAELTDYVVRELSDPNYNSLEVAELPTNGGSGDSAALTTIANGQLAASAPADNSTIMNTMNVHNAQQQLVMQFSNVNKLHIGSVLNFNTNLSASNAPKGGPGICASEEAACGPFPNGASATKRQTTRKTTSIVGMMQSQEEPNHRMLDTIATHLGEGWKEVMRKLGHSEGQIDQAVIDHQMHGGIREVIYQLLLQWVRNADDGFGTLGHITSLLWESNHRDCVQRMKLVWKAEVNRKTSR